MIFPEKHSLKHAFGLKRLLGTELFRAGFWLTFASVLSGGLGYLYQVLMGRLLEPGEFALLSAIMAFAMFLASPLNSILMIVSRKVSTLRAQGDMWQVRKVYFDAHKFVFYIFISLGVIFYFFLNHALDWLNTESHVAVLLLFVMLLMFSMQAVNNGFYQGFKFFRWLGFLGLMAALLKVVFSLAFVLYGYSVEGAIAGVVLAAAASWILGGYVLCRLIPAPREKELGVKVGYSLQPFLPVLAANVAFAVMTQLDMVLVNIFFDSTLAGTYAAASVLGKAVLYLPGGLVLALFPLVADNHANKTSSNLLLLQAVFLTGAICTFASIVYWLFGNEIISTLYGDQYTGAGELLRWYGFAILPLAFVLVAEHFLIAKGQVIFAWLFLLVAPLQIIAIYFWHENLSQVLIAMAAGGFLLAAIGYGILISKGIIDNKQVISRKK